MPKFPRRVTVASTLLTLLAFSPVGRADESAECVAAYEAAQHARLAGKLVEARRQLMVCAKGSCPSVVRGDCSSWLEEVELAIPTLIIGATDPQGDDVPKVRVWLDEELIATELDGKPINVDPGQHLLKYDSPGFVPGQQNLLTLQNTKNRVVALKLEPVAPPVEAPRPPPVPVWLGYGLAGLAVASGAGFGYLQISARSDVDTLRHTCAPYCAQADVDSIETKAVVSQVALGVGIAAAIGAAWVFLSRSEGSDAVRAVPAVRASPRAIGPELRVTF